MIVEVRSYRIKPGRRQEFIEFFETRSVPALRAHGMKVWARCLISRIRTSSSGCAAFLRWRNETE